MGSDREAIVRMVTERFSLSKLVSNLSIVSGTLLGVAGFLFVFKNGRFLNLNRLFSVTKQDAGEDDSYHHNHHHHHLVPGLLNLGNNCFLNVILQALASCKDFQNFLQWAIEEDARETVSGGQEEDHQHFPLTFALSTLLQGLCLLLVQTWFMFMNFQSFCYWLDLCIVGSRPSVCSPRNVMLALSHYVRDFNLTSQQDAAEALLHLLSSLQEEIVLCYRPSKITTLSDIIFSRNLRMLAPIEGFQELKRWHQHLRGPFDGILASTLMCRICSSQISLEFQFFHTLPLSPLLHSGNSNIMIGTTLENCLKKFLEAEKVENYFCQRCWHGAALKYSSAIGAAETDIDKVKSCGKDEQCDCKTCLPYLERMPWSNSYSHILKQLTIARFPKLMCIQLQRASLNMFGESIKISGHVAFPLVLDMSLFSPSSIGFNTEKIQEATREQGKYRLVTVVEHFGGTGSGHYTVYRSVRVASQEEEEEEDSEELRWFSISDSQVSRVTESDVLGAEVSLLFYERL
ncbi:unnamed protein product [Cochlearia groenlandica]